MVKLKYFGLIHGEKVKHSRITVHLFQYKKTILPAVFKLKFKIFEHLKQL